MGVVTGNMRDLLLTKSFIWKTGLYLKDLRTASYRHYRYAPRDSKPSKTSLFFCPVQGCLNKHLSAPGLTLEKISVSRGEAQPFGKFTRAERPGNSL